MLALFLALALAQTPAPQPAPGWTATTLEAAASDANKKVLADAKPLTITGEVVDVSCYTQMGKRGQAHKACGSKCVLAGEPVGIVTADDTLYILMPEPHHPRRDGQASLAKDYAAKMGDTVTVSGMASHHGGIHTLFIPVTPAAK
jgi:CBS domain-containing protein